MLLIQCNEYTLFSQNLKEQYSSDFSGYSWLVYLDHASRSHIPYLAPKQMWPTDVPRRKGPRAHCPVAGLPCRWETGPLALCPESARHWRKPSCCAILSSKVFPSILGSQKYLIQYGKLHYCSQSHSNTWHFRVTQRNTCKPSRAATNFAKCYSRDGGWQRWGKKWPQRVVRWLSVISITVATKKGNGW